MPIENPRKLKTHFCDRHFDDHDEGVANRFGRYFPVNGSSGNFTDADAHYVGKHYVNNSEPLSMGLEALYLDPVGLAKQDPEFCKMILGLLDGRLG